MSDIILKILSVLGILLLALLALALLTFLLMLFLPITYRIQGRKETALPLEEDGRAGAVPKAGGLELTAGMNWLFGLFRVRYAWPEPGVLTVKLLWFRLLRIKLPPDEKKPEEKSRDKDKKEGGRKSGDKKEQAEAKRQEGQDERPKDGGETKEQAGLRESEAQTGQSLGEESTGAEGEESENREDGSEAGGFLKKFQKIKYTLRDVYDKIKEIWQNISYYTALLQKKAAKRVLEHVKLRLFKILKNIRPRHIRADILFGTGEPDTTGFLYGVYAMLSPVLGDKCLVTPDFERKVLEGRFAMSGHITVIVLLANVIKLMLDKRLRLLIRKMKKE